MNCGNIHELSPLWHSGELEADRRKEFDAHVAGCPDCAAELRDQWANDARLREAMASDIEEQAVSATSVQNRVLRSIARERRMRLLVPALAAAAVLVVGISFWNSHRQIATQTAPIFADAARDHTVEVIDQAPRRWRTNAADIAVLEASQGIADSDVRSLEATGYHLERAKVCRLGATPYMHLVYSRDGHEFSVYMKARGNQPLPDADSSSGKLELASFARGRVQAVIVTDAPHGECAKFAHEAESTL
jgi:anti-sigma factor RsiW